MTASTHQVTRTVVTRSWRDIDPKVAAVAAVTLVADVVLVALYVTGAIPAEVLAAGIGPSSIAVAAGYVKRSTHVDVPAIADQVLAAAEAVTPIIEAVAPAAAPVLDEAVDVVTELRGQLAAQPTAPTIAATAVPAVPMVP